MTEEEQRWANRLCPQLGRPVGAPADSQASLPGFDYSETNLSETGSVPEEELVDYFWHNR